MSARRIVWVAGSEGGIGRACVELLEKDGRTVHGSDRPGEDITDPDVAERVAAELAATGSLVGGIYAIGMSGRRYGDGPISTCTDRAWDQIIKVDLTSAFRFLRASLRHAADGSSLVLIGSALAHSLDPDFLTAAYRVAKAGLVPLMEAAAYEGARRGIRVNMVAPGLADTSMATRALGDERIRSRFRELMPLTSRPAQPAEIAAAVRWLISDESVQTTGTVVPVDGGWSLR